MVERLQFSLTSSPSPLLPAVSAVTIYVRAYGSGNLSRAGPNDFFLIFCAILFFLRGT